MNRRQKLSAFFLLSIGLATYGCGSEVNSGSSSVEMSSDGASKSGALDGVTLMGSKQGQSVGLVNVDGDGISDKVVGAPYAATSSKTGAVLVYKGSSTGGFSSAPTTLISGNDNIGFPLSSLKRGQTILQSNLPLGRLTVMGMMYPYVVRFPYINPVLPDRCS